MTDGQTENIMLINCEANNKILNNLKQFYSKIYVISMDESWFNVALEIMSYTLCTYNDVMRAYKN